MNKYEYIITSVLKMHCREWNDWLRGVLQCDEAASANISRSWRPASI